MSRLRLIFGGMGIWLLLALSGLAFSQPAVTLTFWSTEEEPERAAATRAIIQQFTEATGIRVSLVLSNEDILNELIRVSVESGTLADVIFHPLDYGAIWHSEGILDAVAATQVIQELGVEQFSALNLVADGRGGYVAVPADGWGQLLIYRQDLFAAAGLSAPTTFDRILTAASQLHAPERNFFGIVAATDPQVVFTQQTFEHFALANGVQLTDDDGNITLNTPAMIETLAFYTDLVSRYGPPGIIDVATSRATYFDGRAAMIVWSPFILDEMAGLRDNALPTCLECRQDSAFLARNSAFVPAFVGPSGSAPVQFGQVSVLGITSGAPPEAVEFVKFWLSDGYLDWLAVAPEGKFPMRRGTPTQPNLYVEGWSQLPTGVDRKAALSEFYSSAVIDTIAQGATGFDRWGFVEGQGRLVGALYEALIIPRAIRDILDGRLSVRAAAEQIQLEVEALQAGL